MKLSNRVLGIGLLVLVACAAGCLREARGNATPSAQVAGPAR